MMLTKEGLEKVICNITTEAFTKNKDSIIENIQKNIMGKDDCTTAFSAAMAAYGVEIIKQFNCILIKTLSSIFYDDNEEKLYDLCGDKGDQQNG